MNLYSRAVISIILSFFIFALSWIDAQAQESEQELQRRIDQMALQMVSPAFLQMIRADINPIFMNLASAFSHDEKLTDLLKAVMLNVFPHFTGPYSAKAGADRFGGNRTVEVDMSFIISTKIIARVAVCERVLPKSFDLLMNTWKRAVANVIRKGIQSRTPISSMPSFAYWDFQVDQMLNKYIEQFAEKAYLDILTWVILHEIGHHYLGHLDSSVLTDQKSRERELAADCWGYKKMKFLGYSLDMVFQFLLIQAELEEKVYGSVAEAGSHPSWYKRAHHLVDHFSLNEKITRSLTFLQCVFESKNQHTDGLYTTDAVIVFPTNPAEYGSVLGAIFIGNESQFLATEINGNEAHLYGRVLNERSSKIIVKDASSFAPTIEIRDSDSPYSEPYCIGVAFENPFVHFYGLLQSAGLPIRQTDTQSPRAILMQTLKSTYAGQAALRTAEQAIDSYLIAQRELLYAYMKGNQSYSSFEKAWNAASNRYKSNLRTALGSDRYSRFESVLYTKKYIQFGISNLLKLSRDSNRRIIDIFQKLRGHRDDLKPASRRFRNVRLRSVGLQQLESDKEILAKYEMEAAGGFPNAFETQTSNGKKVIVDNTCSLMWQHDGSSEKMEYSGVQSLIRRLNNSRFAGFSDWRLPTLEEALTLLEPEYFSNEMYIQPVFGNDQTLIWTSDHYLSTIYIVDYRNGLSSIQKPDEKCFIRAVRSLY